MDEVQQQKGSSIEEVQEEGEGKKRENTRKGLEVEN